MRCPKLIKMLTPDTQSVLHAKEVLRGYCPNLSGLSHTHYIWYRVTLSPVCFLFDRKHFTKSK